MKVQNSDLADNRFGNQIFQYFFLKLVEDSLKLRATCPPWVGSQLFDLDFSEECNDRAVTLDLEPNIDRSEGFSKELNNIAEFCKLHADGAVNIRGYFQYHTWHYRNYKKLFLTSFTFREVIIQQITLAINNIGLKDAFIIGTHVRAGDYRKHTAYHSLFWMPSVDSYIRAISNIKDSHIKNYVIYLASDEIEYFSPILLENGLTIITRENLFHELTPIQAMILDYYVLAISDALIISNSSFSFSASMLNQRSRIFMRPGVRSDDFIPFDPWNSHVLIPRSDSFSVS